MRTCLDSFPPRGVLGTSCSTWFPKSNGGGICCSLGSFNETFKNETKIVYYS